MTWYINVGRHNKVETIDQFDTHREALEALREYRLSMPDAIRLRISQRCTNMWKESFL